MNAEEGIAETMTEDSETTEADETTEAGGTTEAAIANNVVRSTITIGPARSVRTPTSLSGTPATVAKPHDRAAVGAAADGETITVSVPAATNKETVTVDEAMMAVNNEDDRRTAVVVLAHNVVNQRMSNPAEPKGSAQVMLTINHLEISEHPEGLSAEMTEWT